MLPKREIFTTMCVGGDQDKWWRVFESLLHETIELATLRTGCHFSPNAETGEDVSTCIIVMRHHEFSEVAGLVADFVAACQWDLHQAWKKMHSGKLKDKKEK